MVDLEQLASRPQAPCGAEPFHTWNCADGTTWTAFYRYELGGLRIVSDLPLVGLQVCHNEARADGNEVVIRHAAIPESLALNTATFRDGRFFSGGYNGKEVLLDIPEAGRILVRAGKEIVLDRLPCSSDGEVRSYLLGSALGLLCHQRGIAPLHCSAVDVPDGCVAFVGDSGAGKSTLIAALAKHGHSVICDDVCLLRLGANDTVHAWPGISRIRLWEDARSALGYDDPGIERELYGYNKYLVPVRPPRNPLQSRRLRRVYQLHAASDDVSKVTSLKGAAALEAIMRNVYRLGFAECLGYKPQVFKFSAAAARDVPVFQFSRPLGFNCLGKSIELLENHLRDIC